MSLLDRVRQTQRVKRAARASRLPGGPAGIPGTGSPPRPWWVDLRIDRRDWPRVEAAGLVLERVDLDPPAAGPEAEITVQVDATTEAIADRLGRRVLERLSVPVLASRAYGKAARR